MSHSEDFAEEVANVQLIPSVWDKLTDQSGLSQEWMAAMVLCMFDGSGDECGAAIEDQTAQIAEV